jgi:branched-subunit amino acid ABC-type transport system permease component
MDPWVGARMFITIFAACILGGIKSVYGSIVGGSIIAFSEIFLSYFLSFFFPWVWSYRSVISMIVAAVSLVKMPEGFAGYISKVRKGG